MRQHVTLLLLLVLVAPMSLLAADPAIICGATLGPGNTYTLEADLTCPDDTPALILLGETTLDLGGHTLSTRGGVQLGDGVASGDGIMVRNGRIADCSAKGWCLLTYDEVNISAFHDLILEGGIDFNGDGNAFARVQVGEPGIWLYGHHNRLDQLHVISARTGISLGGRENRLTHTLASCSTTPIPDPNSTTGFATTAPCVELHGDHTLVARVTIVGGGIGLSVDGQRNLILGVRVKGTITVDAMDRTSEDFPRPGQCSRNVWLFNRFASTDPPCLLTPPRVRPCVALDLKK